MPKIPFTQRKLASLVAPNTGQVDYFDTGLPGFGLRVSYGGRKSWVVMYRHGSVKRRQTFGSFPALPLSDARKRAKAILHEVQLGKDPAEQKLANRRAGTVAELSERYIRDYAKKAKRTWRTDQRILRLDVVPRIGRMRVNDVTRRDVKAILREVADRSPIMGNRTLEVVRKMFSWAVAEDEVEANPCFGILKPLAREPRRERVLDDTELKRLLEAVDADEHILAGTAIKLLLLSAQRVGEVLSMRWDDVSEGEELWWTVPAEIAKNGLSHRVPLTSSSVEILEGIRALNLHPVFVFPKRGNGPATNSFIRKPFLRINKASEITDLRPHDLRRSAASHMTGMGISRLTVGKLLNHVETGATAVYDRHGYDGEKRSALQAWDDKLSQIRCEPGNVIRLARDG